MSDDEGLQSSTAITGEAVLKALPDPAALLDASGVVIAVNPAFSQAFGDGPWIGRSLRDLNAPLTLRAVDGGMALALSSQSADTEDAQGQAEVSSWSYDAAKRLLRLSGPVLELLELPGTDLEILIDEWVERIAPEDRAMMAGATMSLVASGMADVEYRLRTQSGAYVWLNLRGGVSEYGPDGAPLKFTGFLGPAAHRKRLETAFVEGERALFEAVSAGLLGAWNLDMRTQRLSGRGRAMEWIGKPTGGAMIGMEEWLAIVHPEDIEMTRQAYQDVAGGAPVETFDHRLKSPEGWRWVRTRSAIVARAEDGSALRAAGVLIDVTGERAYAKALEAEKQRFESLYRSTPVMLHSLDAQGRTLLVNDLWCARMGYSEAEALGRPGWEFFIPEDARRIREEILPQVLRHGAIDAVPLTALTRSGAPIEVRLSAFLERDASGEPLIAHGAFSDVSDLNAARRALEAHAAALERSNRELDRCATVASHDLQEPLRKISAFASLLARRYEDQIDADGRQSLAYLVDAAMRMRRLIDDLLAYSRTSNRELEFGPVDLSALFATTLDELSLMVAEARAEIECGPLPTVQADLTLMRLLLQNLLSNALKYRKGAHVRIVVRAERDGEAWRITVADDGIGFDPRFAEKVFAPFQRLHNREAFSGTGIGLAICQQAVERHGGRIWVDTEPGFGARFHFTLPDRAQAEPQGSIRSPAQSNT
ncbi:MAG: PAS domain-containing protein [Oceanicaulis sp.]|nr:PAS domain-containing protein [Oceanicaulis sp.]